MIVPENPFTLQGAPKQKRRFNNVIVNQHYQRNADIFNGYSENFDHYLNPMRKDSPVNIEPL